MLKLPTDLRCRIWKMTLPPGRQVLLSPTCLANGYLIPPPVALLVHRESRNEVLKDMIVYQHPPFDSMPTIKLNLIRINTELDSVVIRAGDLFNNHWFGIWVHRLSRSQGNKNKLDKIRNLEICFDRRDGHAFCMIYAFARCRAYPEDQIKQAHPQQRFYMKLMNINGTIARLVLGRFFHSLIFFKGLETVSITRLQNDLFLETVGEGETEPYIQQIEKCCRNQLNDLCNRNLFATGTVPHVKTDISPRVRPWTADFRVADLVIGHALYLLVFKIPALYKDLHSCYCHRCLEECFQKIESLELLTKSFTRWS